MNNTSALQFFVAWGLIIGSLFGLSRFDAGKRVTYYALWLAIVLVLVTHAENFIALIRPSGIFPDTIGTGQTGNPPPPPPAGVITPQTVQAIPMAGR